MAIEEVNVKDTLCAQAHFRGADTRVCRLDNRVATFLRLRYSKGA
ncbi:MAG TPA: hypothetical protein VH325_19365 [Bryobacteraceae bacterium]|nr:hypothetical protein [Bryobacteraceae bacterium]